MLPSGRPVAPLSPITQTQNYAPPHRVSYKVCIMVSAVSPAQSSEA